MWFVVLVYNKLEIQSRPGMLPNSYERQTHFKDSIINWEKGAYTNFKTDEEIEASGRGAVQVSVRRKGKSHTGKWESWIVVVALIKTYHNLEFTTQR